MRLRFVGTVTLLLLGAVLAAAESKNPVTWTLTLDQSSAAPGSVVQAKINAKLEPGWHIYALSNPPGGPTPTTFKVNPPNPAIGSLRLYEPKPETKYDQNFQQNVEAFENEVTFLAAIEVAANAPQGSTEVSLFGRYQACTDKQCLPKKTTLTAALKVDPAAVKTAAFTPPAGYTEWSKPPAAAVPGNAATSGSPPQDQSLATFLLVAFGFGLAAIFTPCVFPMIPITLSFFLNREGVPAESR